MYLRTIAILPSPQDDSDGRRGDVYLRTIVTTATAQTVLMVEGRYVFVTIAIEPPPQPPGDSDGCMETCI
jgi:hypothetical protein